MTLLHGFKLLTITPLSLSSSSLPPSLSFILTALSLQDALVANYPKLASDEKNSFVREELEIFL